MENYMINGQCYDLLINGRINPLSIEGNSLSFSWKSNLLWQAAYKIEIFERYPKKRSVWNSSKMNSSESSYCQFDNLPLERLTTYQFTITAFGDNDDECMGSGVFRTSDDLWNPRWIGKANGASTFANPLPAPMFRKKFTVGTKASKVYLSIAGLGYYDCRINNKSINEYVLKQPFTRYDKTVLFDTFDITEFVSKSNKLDVLLGNGWYDSFPRDEFNFSASTWKSQPKLAFDIQVEYEDGHLSHFESNEDVITGDSAIYYNALRNGEYVNTQLSTFNWPNIEDECFSEAAVSVRPPGGKLLPNTIDQIIVEKTLDPKSITQLGPQKFMIDFGENVSGFCNIVGKEGKNEGKTLVLRFGERIYGNGKLDTAIIDRFVFEGHFQEDRVILNGKPINWHPSFVYHGFQYVEVSGIDSIEDVEISALFVHSNLRKAGEFHTGNGLINWIQSASVHSALSNVHSIPTDCPHREKNGWTGDMVASIEQYLYNFDSKNFFEQWLLDFKDVQRDTGQLPGIIPTSTWGYEFGSGPAWDSALIIVAYELYWYSGDKSILKALYPNFIKYLDYLDYMSRGNLVNFGLGDYCSPDPNGGAESYNCPIELTDSTFYLADLLLVDEIAKILGHYDQLQRIEDKITSVREALLRKYVNGDLRTLVNQSQTALLVLLHYKLYDSEAERKTIAKQLQHLIIENDYHHDCGVIGIKYLFPVLFTEGLEEEALRIMLQKSFPSWGYWKELGATSLWEDWSGKNSRNHHMFSNISAGFYKYFAGIKNVEPGFKRINIKPIFVVDFGEVEASYNSPYGQIKVNYNFKEKENLWACSFEIPFNTRATFEYFDPEKAENETVVLKGGVTKLEIKGEHISCLHLGNLS